MEELEELEKLEDMGWAGAQCTAKIMCKKVVSSFQSL
jgi:hypothetical protein